MVGIKNLWLTASKNTHRFPERQQPSTVNDGARALEADLREFYNNVPWIEYGSGDGPATITYVASNQFKIASSVDLTPVYHVGRRVRAKGTVTGTIYGTITASSFASSETTVTVQWDSGGLANEALEIAIGIDKTNTPLPDGIAWADSANTFKGAQTIDGDLSVTGDLAITPSPSTNSVVVSGNSTAASASAPLLSLRGKGHNAAAAVFEYGRIEYVIDGAAAGSEAGRVVVHAAVSGSLAPRLEIGAGVLVGNATDGFKGHGTLNATNLFVNGAAVALAGRSITTGTGLTGGGDLTADRIIAADIATQQEAEDGTSSTKLMTPERVAQHVEKRFFEGTEVQVPVTTPAVVEQAHGFPARPRRYEGFLRCVSADGNWGVGDEMNLAYLYRSGDGAPVATVYADATNVGVSVRTGGSWYAYDPSGSGNGVALNLSKWRIVLRAEK